MTHKRKNSLLIVIATLFLASVATAAYCDSFVDDAALKTSTDLRTTLSATSSCPAGKVAPSHIQGDSFVSDSAMDALENFRFTRPDLHSHNVSTDQAVTVKSQMNTNDSFVNTDTI